jgi:hypothetical protein
MPPKRRGQQSSAPSSSAQTTRQTRRQASRVEADVTKNTKEEGQVPVGKLQPSKVPRRFAPHARTRGQSVESLATDDLANATDGVLSKRPSESTPSSSSQHLLMPSAGDPDEHEQDVPEDQEEDGDADEWLSASAQDIMDIVLPDIVRCNERLYEHIQSLDSDPPTRSWWARLRLIEGLYSSARRSLAPGQSHFIDLKVLEERLPGIDRDSKSFHAARATLCSANLASLIKLIVQVGNQRVELGSVIGQIEDGFPVMFDAHLKHGPGINMVTYDLAFRLHCRFLIEGMRTVGSNPFVMAVKVFCSEDAPSTVKQAKAMLLAGPYQDFARVDVNGQGEVAEMHSGRMKALCSHLSRHQQRSETLKELEIAYPLDGLLAELDVWALSALEDTEGRVDKKGKAPERISSNSPAEDRQDHNLASRSSKSAPRPPHRPAKMASANAGKSVELPKEASLFVEENGSDSDSDPEEEESIIRLGAPA